VTRAALLDAVRAASRGEMLLRPEVVARALARTRSSHPPEAPPGGPLSEREREVLDGVARDERNKAIAERLGITERTVKAHLSSAFNKLGVDSRAGAVSVALRRGLLAKTRPPG
jgi:NarL family two-component system response regulator YdfI